MELMKAHQQWANRPKDERFESLESMHAACKAYAASAREKTVPYSELRTEAVNGDVQLVGRAGVPAMLTHWSFGQIAARTSAPANYLRTLPATLACQNLNHGLARIGNDSAVSDAKLMFHSNGSLLLRAITSERYERIWNYEVTERLLDLQCRGWEPARPDVNAFAGDSPALYASDHDMFAFMRSRNVTIDEPGTSEPIYRGVIVENSEVGAAALKLTRFLYRYMCGNHIIWGASKVVDLSIRHIGDARDRWSRFAVTARQWAEDSASEETAMIARAKSTVIAATKEQVLDAVFGKRAVGLSRKVLDAGYDAALPAQDGDPRTVWGLVQGLTRHSQTTPYADERTAIDRAAGKILEVTF